MFLLWEKRNKVNKMHKFHQFPGTGIKCVQQIQSIKDQKAEVVIPLMF